VILVDQSAENGDTSATGEAEDGAEAVDGLLFFATGVTSMIESYSTPVLLQPRTGSCQVKCDRLCPLGWLWLVGVLASRVEVRPAAVALSSRPASARRRTARPPPAIG
jgi:hypothetical protein